MSPLEQLWAWLQQQTPTARAQKSALEQLRQEDREKIARMLSRGNGYGMPTLYDRLRDETNLFEALNRTDMMNDVGGPLRFARPRQYKGYL